MSYFTDFRDAAVKAAGLDSGTSAAKTIAGVASNAYIKPAPEKSATMPAASRADIIPTVSPQVATAAKISVPLILGIIVAVYLLKGKN